MEAVLSRSKETFAAALREAKEKYDPEKVWYIFVLSFVLQHTAVALQAWSNSVIQLCGRTHILLFSRVKCLANTITRTCSPTFENTYILFWELRQTFPKNMFNSQPLQGIPACTSAY